MSICVADALIRCVRGWKGQGQDHLWSVHCSLATEDAPFHKLTPFDCLVHRMFAETGADKIHSGARKVCWDRQSQHPDYVVVKRGES